MGNNLGRAIELKDVRTIEALLAKYQNESNIDADMPTVPLELIKSFNLNDDRCKEIFFLLATHPFININSSKTENGDTILHLAETKMIVVYSLNYADVDIDAQNKSGETPLMTKLKLLRVDQRGKSASRTVDICKCLIENGANLKLADSNGNSPIHVASHFSLNSKKINDLVNTLIKHSQIDLNAQNNEGKTALHLAETVEMIESLLSTGKLDLKIKDSYGHSALSNTLLKIINAPVKERQKLIEICKVLIEKETDSVFNDENFKQLPLYCLYDGLNLNDDLVKKLLAYVVEHRQDDVNSADSDGNTILHLNKSELIVKFILNNISGVNINARNKHGQTLLMVHFKNLVLFQWDFETNAAICKLLTEKGADLSELSPQLNLCPLHILANLPLNNDVAMDFFQYVVNLPQVDINVPDGNGNTLLHLSSSLSMVKTLLSHPNIDINAQNKEGNTPILRFFHSKFKDGEEFEIANVLVNAGADLNIINQWGKPLLYYVFQAYTDKYKDVFVNMLHHFSEDVLTNFKTGYYNRILLEHLYLNFQWPIEEVVSVPFEIAHFMNLFFYVDSSDKIRVVETIYKKWDEQNFPNLIDKLLKFYNDNRKFQETHNEYICECFNRIVQRLWQYIFKHKEQMTEANYRTFFNNMRFPIFRRFDTPNKGVFEEFYHFYRLYNDKPELLSPSRIDTVYDAYGDCVIIRDILELNDSSNIHFDIDDYPFLFSITRHYDGAPELCEQILRCTRWDPTRISRVQNVARYYTLSENLLTFLINHLPICECFKDIVQQPRPLLELSRDAIRSIFRTKYRINCPKDMKLVLDKLRIPRLIQDILLLRRPIYHRIQNSLEDAEHVQKCVGCPCRFCTMESESSNSDEREYFDEDPEEDLSDDSVGSQETPKPPVNQAAAAAAPAADDGNGPIMIGYKRKCPFEQEKGGD